MHKMGEERAMDRTKPLPAVGDRIKLDYGPNNINTWKCAGEVRAVVDEMYIVVRRWLPRKRYHYYELIDRLRWEWPQFQKVQP